MMGGVASGENGTFQRRRACNVSSRCARVGLWTARSELQVVHGIIGTLLLGKNSG
jgi:hypothetical protein